MSKYILIILFFTFSCSGIQKYKMPEVDKDFFPKLKASIVEHRINDFIKADDDLNNIPDYQISIVLTEPIDFHTLFQILVAQGVNVIENLETEKMISIPNYSGSLKEFLQTIQDCYGLFFKYRNNTLTVREKTTVYVKVLMSGIEDKLQNILKTFGIENSFYDQLSSRILFETDFYTYQKVQDYFYNNPYLSFIIFDVLILEHEESKEHNKGIDWSTLAINLNEFSKLPFKMNLNGDTQGAFDINLGKDFLSLQAVYENLLKLEEFKIVQSARISTLNGYNCVLDVSEKIPYIARVDISTLGNNSDSVVAGYEFGIATSGLVLNLLPVVSGNLVSIVFDSKIQSLIKFIEVGAATQIVQQPVLAIRNLKNQIVITPGETTLIGGLQYQKGGFSNKTLDFLPGGGLTNDNLRTFSITVLLRCELVRYVFTKGRL